MNKRLILSTIFLTIAVDFFNLGMIFPMFSSLVFETDPSMSLLSAEASPFTRNAAYGILIAMFAIGQFIGAPVLGMLSDIYGRKKLLIYSLLGAIGSAVLCAGGILAGSLLWTLLGRFLGGLMAGNMTLAYATLTDISAPEEKVKNFAIIPLATGMGFAAGPYVAGSLMDAYEGWAGQAALPFLVACALILVNLLLALWKFPETLSATKTGSVLNALTLGLKNISCTIRPNPMRRYFWIAFLMISSNFVFCQFVGPFAIERYQASVQDLGLLYANVGFSVALGHIFLTRRLASVLSVEQALRGSLVALVLLLTAAIFSPTLLWLHVFTFFIMLGFAVAYTNSMALLSNKAPEGRQGEVMGIAVSIQSCSEFLPAMVLGFFAWFAMALPIAAAALLALGSFGLLKPLMEMQVER